MDNFTYPIPKEWQWTTLNQLLIGYRFGISASAGTESLFVVRPKHVFNGKVHLTNIAKIGPVDDRSLLKSGEVLVSCGHSYDKVGKAGLYEGAANAICSPYLVRLQVDKKIIYPGYLSFWLNSETVKKFLIRIKSRGIGATKINMKTYIKFCPILVPPKGKQKQIIETLALWDSMLSLLQTQIDILSEQRKGIAQLFLNQIGPKRL